MIEDLVEGVGELCREELRLADLRDLFPMPPAPPDSDLSDLTDPGGLGGLSSTCRLLPLESRDSSTPVPLPGLNEDPADEDVVEQPDPSP